MQTRIRRKKKKKKRRVGRLPVGTPVRRSAHTPACRASRGWLENFFFIYSPLLLFSSSLASTEENNRSRPSAGVGNFSQDVSGRHGTRNPPVGREGGRRTPPREHRAGGVGGDLTQPSSVRGRPKLNLHVWRTYLQECLSCLGMRRFASANRHGAVSEISNRRPFFAGHWLRFGGLSHPDLFLDTDTQKLWEELGSLLSLGVIGNKFAIRSSTPRCRRAGCGQRARHLQDPEKPAKKEVTPSFAYSSGIGHTCGHLRAQF